MPLSYDPSLVLLSLALAIQGSYVCLRIALQINGSHGLKRRLLLTGAAFSLAVAIWSMHFVSMLAVRLPVTIYQLSRASHASLFSRLCAGRRRCS